jgi:hypothetical protein
VKQQRVVVLAMLESSTDPSQRAVLAHQAEALGRVLERLQSQEVHDEHEIFPVVPKEKSVEAAKQQGGIVGGRINQVKVAIQESKAPTLPAKMNSSEERKRQRELEKEKKYLEDLLQIQKPWPPCVDTPIETQELSPPQDLKIIQSAYYDPDYSSVANTSALSLMSRTLIKSAINHTYCRHGLTRIVDRFYRCDH